MSDNKFVFLFKNRENDNGTTQKSTDTAQKHSIGQPTHTTCSKIEIRCRQRKKVCHAGSVILLADKAPTNLRKCRKAIFQKAGMATQRTMT
ncbi:hypothetical protein CEXT_307751 [Caerostris extrusa]|uniref:Uncharacterized protein n=1 Tax=Caerostris extrusa TaxID=172846 RepID=A0AAV4UA35_CAEEX|nr:hypothetical protein CEXT_307751 [Caerostris extrusa]